MAILTAAERAERIAKYEQVELGLNEELHDLHNKLQEVQIRLYLLRNGEDDEDSATNGTAKP